MSGVELQGDFSGAFGVMGYVSGVSVTVKTSAYIGAVLNYTHARLSAFFNEWMDAKAREDPSAFQHMYEWPDHYQDYSETVGIPEYRLWEHTLSGTGSNVRASFDFLPSKRPTPVDPLLLEPGPDGQVVKEGVHIFIWKAEAMEYGTPIVVTPTLAKMLAYIGRDQNSGGSDPGWHHATEQEGGHSVNFSSGPVHFTAGGGKSTGKFTTAYLLWWSTMAEGDFKTSIAPELEKDLVDQAALTKVARARNKKVNISAQAAADAKSFAEAEALAIADLKAKGGEYIKRAAAERRMALYGE